MSKRFYPDVAKESNLNNEGQRQALTEDVPKDTFPVLCGSLKVIF